MNSGTTFFNPIIHFYCTCVCARGIPSYLSEAPAHNSDSCGEKADIRDMSSHMCSLRDRLRLYVWFREEIAASATIATTTQPLPLIVPNEAHDSLLECLFKIPAICTHIHVDCFTLHLCLHTGRLVATTFRSISCWRSHASQPALLFAACSRPGRAGLLSFRPIPSSRMRFGLPASASPCDTISKHRLSRTSSASSIMCGGGSCIAASSAAGSRWTLCLVTG